VYGSVSTLESQSAKAGAKIVAPARSSEAAAPRERPSSGEPVAHSAPPKNGAAMGETLATGDAIHVDAAKDKERLSGSSERRAVPPARDQVASNAGGAAASVVPPDPTKALTWISFRSARFGFSLAYPSEVFLADAAPSDEGASFRSRDGRARLTISVGMNTDRTTLAAHRRSLMNGPYGGAVFDYAPRRAYWFVLSGILGSEIFYQRVTFSCDRRTVHSWKLVYPLSERALYDRIVEGVHRRYHHGNGPGARCEGASQEAARKGEG
jgi:hypothetical protein